jgi:hypothetical protein
MTGLAWNLTGIIIMADGKLELDEFMGISISTLELTVRSSPSIYCDHGNYTFLAWDSNDLLFFLDMENIAWMNVYFIRKNTTWLLTLLFSPKFSQIGKFCLRFDYKNYYYYFYLSRLKLTSSSDLEETFRKTDLFWMSRIGEYRFGFALEAG